MIKYIHLPFGGKPITIGYEIMGDCAQVAVSVLNRKENDVYCKKIGREIVKERLKNENCSLHSIPLLDGKPFHVQDYIYTELYLKDKLYYVNKQGERRFV